LGTKGTQGDPYGYIKTIKIKIGDIHSKMGVSGRFGAFWPIVGRAGQDCATSLSTTGLLSLALRSKSMTA
jgi:hypothetical protein